MASAFLTRVGGIPYYVPSRTIPILADSKLQIYGNISNQTKHTVPATLIVLETPSDISVDKLRSTISRYRKTDDVFNPSFLENLLFVLPAPEVAIRLDPDSHDLLSEWGTQSAWTVQSQSKQQYHGGPYFATSHALHQAWRIYDDESEAFMFPVVSSEEDPSSFEIPGTSGIPVPSRLYFDPPSAAKPLSGLRTAIKDAIHLKGVRTSAGNRAYKSLFPAQEQNARSVQQLIDAGAVIIGKTKLVQFSSGEMTRDWIDYLAPFNPRGDGYQDAGCSSTGSSSAISTYDFVDVALGTDTLGSVLSPAAIHGLYGLRPTLRGISTDGVIPVSSALDTVGIFARDVNIMFQTASVLLISKADNSQNFGGGAVNSLLYPEKFFSEKPERYNDIINQFVQDFSAFLDVSRTLFDLDAEWMLYQDKGGSSIAEFLHPVCAEIQLFDCYRNSLAWRSKYQEQFGRRAIADPFIEYKWKMGSEITEHQYSQARGKQDKFRSFMDQLLPLKKGGNVSYDILLAPCERGEICYRGDYKGETLEEAAPQLQGYGFWPSQVSVIAGLPWFTVPIGQMAYESEVTNRLEINPVCIGLIGPAGSEKFLIGAVKAFFNESPKYRSFVHTGKQAFPRHSTSPPLGSYQVEPEPESYGKSDLKRGTLFNKGYKLEYRAAA